jgi:hypothetical protein
LVENDSKTYTLDLKNNSIYKIQLSLQTPFDCKEFVFGHYIIYNSNNATNNQTSNDLIKNELKFKDMPFIFWSYDSAIYISSNYIFIIIYNKTYDNSNLNLEYLLYDMGEF